MRSRSTRVLPHRLANSVCWKQILRKHGDEVQPHLRRGDSGSLGRQEVRILPARPTKFHPLPQSQPLHQDLLALHVAGRYPKPMPPQPEDPAPTVPLHPGLRTGQGACHAGLLVPPLSLQSPAPFPALPIDLLDIKNVDALYSSAFGPPS